MTVLAIVGWDKYQHYKDRDPPWVKLYRDLLTSESWVLGTDSSRLLQVASILLAARYTNKIPFRWALLKKVASLDMSEREFKTAVEHLVEHNFLEYQQVTTDDKPVVQSASTTLATCTSEAEQRQSRAEAEQTLSRESTSSTSDPCVSRGTSAAEQEVFDHWKRVWNHPLAVFDAKRRGRIRARLKEFTVDQLRDCISGFRNSPWHCGTDPKGGGRVYDALDTLLRDTAQVEEGIRLLQNPPRAPPKAESAMERILRANSPDNSRVIEHEPEFRALPG